MSGEFDRDAFLTMAHKEVKALYEAMFGAPPRSPNKVWMINQMQLEHVARKVAQEEASAARRGPRAEETPSADGAETGNGAVEAGDVEVRELSPDETATPAATASAVVAGGSTAPPVHVRGRFRSMTVEELRTLYAQTVGRATSSLDKHYLIWKIREAEKGRIRVGPVEPGQRRGGTLVGSDKTLPLTLPTPAVEALDAAWMRTGFTSRMSFMRAAIREALARRGEMAAAAHIPATPGEAHR